MTKGWSPWLKWFLGLTIFSLCGSAASHFLRLDPGPIAPAASVATLLVGLAAVFAGKAALWGGKRLAAALGLLGLAGAASEVAGLYTGWIFGRYEYTREWWPTLLLPGDKPFPLLLPFAWMMMAGGSYLAIRRAFPEWGAWGAVVPGGILAAAIDLPMEHVMVRVLGYWRWLEAGPLPGGAPVANTIGWVAVSSLGGLLLAACEKRWEEKDSPGDPRPVPEPLLVLCLHGVLLLGLGLIGPRT